MKKTKSMCSGCRQDFYNHNRDGGCWSFASARIRKRMIVGTFENPPYNKNRLESTLSCYQPERGESIIDADDCRVSAAEKTA